MASKIKFDIPNYSLMLLDAVEKTKQEVGFKIEQYAKESAPVDTGYYRNNINFDGENKVIANAEYSAAIEYGVKARIIKAKNAKVLHFTYKGKEVFAKYVKQSARAPKPVMRNAAMRVQKEVGGIFIVHFKKR